MGYSGRFSGCSALVAFSLFAVTAARAADPGDPPPIPVADVKPAQPLDFGRDVMPIFRQSCVACHNAQTHKGGLVLESPAAIQKGGDTGPAAAVGKGAESLLVLAASHRGDSPMPPKNNKAGAVDLTPEQLGILKLWIDQGMKGSASAAHAVEWQPLPAGLNPIQACDVTSDGRFIAASRANQIFVYDAATQALVTRLTDPSLVSAVTQGRPGVAHRDLVQSLKFSRDGKLLASGGYREVKIWRRPEPALTYSWDTAGTKTINAVAATPDGKFAALGGDDGIIRLVSPVDGKLLAELKGHSGAVTALSFTSDGARLFSASADKTIRSWSIPDGKPLDRILAPQPVAAMALLAGDKQIVTGSTGENLARLWNAPTTVEAVAGIEGPITATCVSPDGKRAAVAGGPKNTVTIFDTATEKMLSVFESPTPVRILSLDNAGKSLLTVGDDPTVTVWELTAANSKPRLTLSLSAKPAAAALRPDGKQVVTVDGNGVKAWSLATPDPRAVVKKEDAEAKLIVASSDRRFVAMVVDILGKPAIVVRSIENGAAVQTIGGLAGAPTSVAFSQDGSRLIAGFADNTATAWTIADARPIGPAFKGHAKPVTAVALHPDGAHAVSASEDGAVKVWKLADGVEEKSLAGHTGPIVAMGFPAGQTILVTASADKSVRVFDPLAGTQTRAIDLPAAATAMTISPDGVTCAVASGDKTVRLFKIADGSAVGQFAVSEDARSLSFNSDATNPRLLVLNAKGSATLLDAKDGSATEVLRAEGATFASFGVQPAEFLVAEKSRPLTSIASRYERTLTSNAKPVTRVVYNADGTLVFSSGEDGSVRAVASNDGGQRFTIDTGSAVRGLAVSADGQWLAVGGEDKQLRVYNAGNGQPAQWKFDGAAFTAPPSALAFSADSRRLVAGGAAGGLMVYTMAGEEAQRQDNSALLEGCAGPADAAGRVVVIGSGAADAKAPLRVLAATASGLSRVTTSFARPVGSFNAPVTALAAVPGEATPFCAGGGDGSVRVISTANGQEQRRFDLGTAVTSVAVSPDRARFAAAGGNFARIFKLDGQQLEPLRGDRDAYAAAETKQRLAEYAQSEVQYWKNQVDEITKRQQQEKDGITRATAAKDEATKALPGKQQKLAERTKARDEAVQKLTDASAALAAATTARDDTVKAATLAEATARDAALADQMAGQTAAKAGEVSSVKAQAAQQAQQLNDQATADADAKNQVAAKAKEAAVAKAAAAQAAAKAAADAKAASDAKPTDDVLKQQAVAAIKVADDVAAQSTTAEAAYVAAQAQSTEAAAKAKAAADAFAVAKKTADEAGAALKLAQDAYAATQKASQAASQESQKAAQKRNQAESAFNRATEQNREASNRARQAKQQFAMSDRDVQSAMLVVMSAEKGVTAAQESAKKAEADLTAAKTNQTAAEAAVKTAQGDVEAARKSASKSEKPITAVAFTRAGDAVVTAGTDGVIRTWSAQTGAPGQSLRSDKLSPVTCVATLPDGAILCGGAGDPAAAARLWNTSGAWTLARTIGTGDAASPLVDRVAAVAFSPDGSTLVTGGGVPSRGGELKFWSVADGSLMKEIPDAHSDTVYALSFCGDGRFLASGGADKFVKVWNITPASGGQPFTLAKALEGHTHHVLGVSMRFDGRTVVSVGADSAFKTWNLATGEQMFNSRPNQFGKLELTSVQHVGFTEVVLLATGDGRLEMIRDTDGGELRRFDIRGDGGGGRGKGRGRGRDRGREAGDSEPPFLYSACATPDGRLIAAGGDDSILRLRDREGRPVADLGPDGRIERK